MAKGSLVNRNRRAKIICDPLDSKRKGGGMGKQLKIYLKGEMISSRSMEKKTPLSRQAPYLLALTEGDRSHVVYLH